MIILKNNDTISHTWAGKFIEAAAQIEVNEYLRIMLIENTLFLEDLNSEKAIINNGDEDLSPSNGLLHLKRQILIVQQNDITKTANALIINFEGNCVVTNHEQGKVTVDIDPEHFGHDYCYSASESQSSTTSISWQDKINYTTASLESGNYRIQFQCEIKREGIGALSKARLNIDETEYCYHAEQADTNDWKVVNGFIRLSLTSGIHNITVQFASGTSGRTISIRRARLELMGAQ